MKAMERELDTSRMITKWAEVQASRDLVLKEKERESENIKGQFRNLESMLWKKMEQEKKDRRRIRELEWLAGNTDKAYMKEVVLKYIEYTLLGDMKAKTLIPALCTLIGASDEEMNDIK